MKSIKNRGFVLIVVLVLAAVAMAIAVGMLGSSGRAMVASIHSSEGDLSRSIAESGLERAEAYAIAAVGTDFDWDRVLDPNSVADCTSLPVNGTITETGNMSLPRFSDALATQTFSGKRFRPVALDGGAYFVRFDDDNDDSIQATQILSVLRMSGNNLAGACAEGLGAPLSGADNPARDRNAQIWVTVIGVHAGTNLATAGHRTVLRKLLFNLNAGPTTSAFAVGGDLNARNFSGCSPVSGIQVGGDLTGSSVCACGTATIGGSTDVSGDCGACCGVQPPLTHAVVAPPPTVTVPPATDASWYDFTSTCNFYLQPGNGFYYWDAAGSRTIAGVPTTCNAYTGNLVAPSPSVTSQGSCWVPLALIAGTVSVPFVALAGEVSSGATGTWTPRDGTAVTFTSSTYFSAPVFVTKPGWDVCPLAGSPSDFNWPPTGPPAPSCTTCNGAAVMDIVASAGASTFQFQNGAGALTAYPTAVFYHQGTFALPNNGTFSGAKPTSQLPSTNWPMISLIVDGNFDIGNPNKALWLGVGTKKGNFLSLMVGGDWDGGPSNIEFAAAGALQVTGDFELKNRDVSFFGPMIVGGDVIAGPGGPSAINWFYGVDLMGGSSAPSTATPPRLAFPLGL